MPNDYSLTELANVAGVSVRTVRYYLAQGLLPSPVQQGPNTRYTDVHLDRLRVIKRLQAAHLPLAEIRRQLEGVTEDKLASLAESAPAYEEPADSALDYIESLLQPRAALATTVPPFPRAAPASEVAMPVWKRAVMPATDFSPPPPPQPSQPPPDSERTQWERIALDPDIELHIRRPLTRQHNKQVERLIKIARELLKEE
jgi:DNA-binding transcriptional MerR regulator